MKERGIIMSGSNPTAILDGSKTQTRRIVKRPKRVPMDYLLNPFLLFEKWSTWWQHPTYAHVGQSQDCPHGQPGDRLWVKETHARYQTVNHIVHSGGRAFDEISDGLCAYKADGFDTIDDLKEHIRLMSGHDLEAVEVKDDRWQPSIFMPRWASRILLEITAVRVERLQEISEEDAIAEGCEKNHNGYFWGGPHADGGRKQLHTAYAAYCDLWRNINGAGSWDANPYVWVIEFTRIKA